MEIDENMTPMTYLATIFFYTSSMKYLKYTTTINYNLTRHPEIKSADLRQRDWSTDYTYHI